MSYVDVRYISSIISRFTNVIPNNTDFFFLYLKLFFSEPAWPIAYAPNNSVVEEIMHHVGKYLYLDTEGKGTVYLCLASLWFNYI